MNTNDIARLANWPDLTAGEILTALTAPQAIRRPKANYTLLGLQQQLGATAVNVMVAKLMAGVDLARANQNYDVAAHMQNALDSLKIGGGPDFGDQVTIEGIEDLVIAEVLSEEEGNALLALGTDSRSHWERWHPNEEPPTEEDIESALVRLRTLTLFQAYAPVIEHCLTHGTHPDLDGAPVEWAVDGLVAVMLAMHSGTVAKNELIPIFASNQPAGGGS